MPLALEARGKAVLAQDIDRPWFQDTGTDAAKDVAARVALKHHALHTLPVQQLGEQQPGGPAADDGDLCAQVSVRREPGAS
jgi:hypothetical protein